MQVNSSVQLSEDALLSTVLFTSDQSKQKKRFKGQCLNCLISKDYDMETSFTKVTQGFFWIEYSVRAKIVDSHFLAF